MAGAGESGSGRSRGPTGGARRARTVGPALRERMTTGLTEAGFDLEDVTVSRAGAHSTVRVIVDRAGGIDLDAVADASRVVSDLLDAAEADGEPLVAGTYVLEVTSPGVDRPLTMPRHWQRAVGRLVTVRGHDGGSTSGRVLSADESGADLAVPTGPARKGRPQRRRVARVEFDQVARATVEVEFSAVEYDDLAGETSDMAPEHVASEDVVPGSTDLPERAAAADLPTAPGPESDNEGRQVGVQGAAGEEMTP